MAIFNKSGIRNYMLCFDGDEAGDKGVARFKRNIRKDVIVNRVLIPIGKDVNDLTKEEFSKLNIETIEKLSKLYHSTNVNLLAKYMKGGKYE